MGLKSIVVCKIPGFEPWPAETDVTSLSFPFPYLTSRFRQVVTENEPEMQEVSALFRSVILEALDRLREEQEAQRLSRQWNNKRAMSMSLMNFKSRIKINPFGSTVGLTSTRGEGELKTVSEDVEKALEERADRAQRVRSMPDFRHKGLYTTKAI